MPDPRSFQFDLAGLARPAPAALAEHIHRKAWAAAPACASLRGAPAREAVRVIVIHATAGSSARGAVSVMQDRRASFHWLVPGANELEHGRFVWATCPERLAAWHVRKACAHPAVCAGAANINRISLGVEIVNTQAPDDPFTGWQVEAAAQIVRYAWARYPGLAHVVSHARLDPTRRTDPGRHFPWAEFRRLVLTA